MMFLDVLDGIDDDDDGGDEARVEEENRDAVTDLNTNTQDWVVGDDEITDLTTNVQDWVGQGGVSVEGDRGEAPNMFHPQPPSVICNLNSLFLFTSILRATTSSQWKNASVQRLLSLDVSSVPSALATRGVRTPLVTKLSRSCSCFPTANHFLQSARYSLCMSLVGSLSAASLFTSILLGLGSYKGFYCSASPTGLVVEMPRPAGEGSSFAVVESRGLFQGTDHHRRTNNFHGCIEGRVQRCSGKDLCGGKAEHPVFFIKKGIGPYKIGIIPLKGPVDQPISNLRGLWTKSLRPASPYPAEPTSEAGILQFLRVAACFLPPTPSVIKPTTYRLGF
ncbi:hypothetical protein IFM89_006011 [Coptis chinensis]|uniref:Uncharacterized protein n=1 Tax=Coptis chinensis TaxID=261450 RepID=A0A835HZU2_9MAGN|nr:hypothetical protein IFM89_006011 [Coptis chinensis]